MITELREEQAQLQRTRLKNHLRNIMHLCTMFEEIASEVSSTLKRVGPSVMYLWVNREKLLLLDCAPCLMIKRFFVTLAWVQDKHTCVPRTNDIRDEDSAHMSDILKNFWLMTEIFPENGYEKPCPNHNILGRWHWILCKKCDLLRSTGDFRLYSSASTINGRFRTICNDQLFDSKILQVRNWTWFESSRYLQLFLSSDGRLSEGGNLASMEEIIVTTAGVLQAGGMEARCSVVARKIVRELKWEEDTIPSGLEWDTQDEVEEGEADIDRILNRTSSDDELETILQSIEPTDEERAEIDRILNRTPSYDELRTLLQNIESLQDERPIH